MSGEFRPVPLTKLPIDAYKHVNYVDGMVLGVDDFEQEFAYLSGRDRLLCRMLMGYGTVRGLRLFARSPGTADAEIVVSAGLGLTPSGDVVRVPADQCARVKDWIEGARVVPPGSGDERVLEAYVTAEYASRTGDPVPIPGEPCRAEDEVMKDSRVVDGFRLELSTEAPPQREEEALTAYLRWLDALPLVETGGARVDDLLQSILRAAWEKPAGTPPSPPAPSGADEPSVFGSHPRGPGGAALQLDRRDALLAQLRALAAIGDVRALSAALESTVTGEVPRAGGKDQTKLLLGKVSIPVVRAGLGSDVFVPKSGAGVEIAIDTSRAPRLLSLRYLMRAAFAGVQRLARSAVTAPPGAKRYVVAAAGQVKVAKNQGAAAPDADSIGGLRAWVAAPDEVAVKFDGLGLPSARYVVKALAGRLGSANPLVNLIAFDTADPSLFRLSVSWSGAPGDAEGLILSIEVGAIVD